MTVHLDKERGKWRYNFQLDNTRHQGYCIHPETRQEARNKTEAKAVEALARAALKRRPLSPVVPVCSMAEAIVYYSKHIGQHLAEWRTQIARLQEFRDYFGDDRDVASVDEELIATYTDWMRKQTVKINTTGPAAINDNRKSKDTGRRRSARTINGYLRLLLRVLRVPPARKYLPAPPEINYLKVPQRKPTPIEQRVAEKILEKSAPHLQRVIVLAVNTGMREREITGARDEQFNAAQRSLYLIENTKARTGRVVPLNAIALEVVEACRQDGDKLWAQLQADEAAAKKYAKQWGIKTRGDIPLILWLPKGKDLLPRPLRSISRAWTEAKRRAGIGGRVRFHDTRASFCSYLAAQGADPYKIQRLAGHKDITTTMLYVNAGDDNLHATVALLADHRPLTIPKVTHKSHSRTEKPKPNKATKSLK